jgi:hypothetical protein
VSTPFTTALKYDVVAAPTRINSIIIPIIVPIDVRAKDQDFL